MRKRRSIFRFLSVLAASSLLLCSLSCGKREPGKDETASSSVTEASKEGGESVSSESGGEKSSADGEKASAPAEESRKPKDASSSAEESRKPEDLPKGKSISGTVRDGSMNSVVIDGDLLTSRGMATAVDLGLEIVRFLLDDDAVDALKKSVVYQR